MQRIDTDYACLPPPEYSKISTILLDPFLPAGKLLKPTLCLSDMHLFAEHRDYADDDPKEILMLLRWFHNYQIFILGDFIESVVLNKLQIFRFFHSERLKPLFKELYYRNALKIIPGNHDVGVIKPMHRYFGSDRLFSGGFRVGKLVFVHGHELGIDSANRTESVGSLVVPVGKVLNRLGFPYYSLYFTINIVCQKLFKAINAAY
jgi:predicted phosphodiesterase